MPPIDFKGFRPKFSSGLKQSNRQSNHQSNLKINTTGLSEETIKSIENDVFTSEFTTMFHIFLSLAGACFAWVFMIRPLMVFPKSYTVFSQQTLAMIFWLLIIPIVIYATNSLNDSIFSKDGVFVYVKFASVWIALLVKMFFVICFIKGYGESSPWFKQFRTVISTGILFANILEASIDQIQGQKENYDIINGSLGIILAVFTIWSGFNNPVTVIKPTTPTEIYSYINFPLSICFILAYTSWNLLFRSYLIQNTGTLFFAVLSLFLPLVLHFLGIGNWLENRAISLFLYAILDIGLAPNGAKIFPMYNEQGYIEQPDSENIISIIQTQEWYKILLIVITVVFLLFSGYNLYTK
jgi:hypothetical protein